MKLRSRWLLLLVLPVVATTAAAQSPPVLYTDSWAVVIGIDDYQHPRISKLRYAVNDARSVEGTLLAQGFRRDHIITLRDKEATKLRIEAALGDDLRQKAGQNDRVLVFFAGHGITDRLRSGEEEGYLLPVDGDPDRLFSTAISMTALRQVSERLRAKHILYVVDACYSGYAFYNRSTSVDLLDEMVKKPAIQILTAGRQADQAQERAGHGVFTDVLVRGLQGEAFGTKGWLALEELGLWIKSRVFAESNKQQLRQYGNLSGEGQFIFLRTAALVQSEATARSESIPKSEGAPQTGVPSDSVLIPAGEFWMGNTQEEMDEVTETCKRTQNPEWYCKKIQHELPGQNVYLNAFFLDRHEVTNADFARFVAATKYRTAAERENRGFVARNSNPPVTVEGANWRVPTGPGSTAKLDHPVVQIAWADAKAYCAWAGKRLPTEAEWEKAARGSDRRRYPWGDAWDHTKANGAMVVKTTSAVGSYPAGVSPYGIHDLAGNAWEWTADWYDEEQYKRGKNRNPTGPWTGTLKVLRGGSWWTAVLSLRTSHRHMATPHSWADTFGFRCAKDASK